MREWMEVGGPGFWCWVSTSLHGSWRVADLFREGLGQGGGGMDMCILRMVGLGRRVRSCRSEQISKTVGE